MDVKPTLINDAKSFHSFLGSSLQLLELGGERTSEDTSLRELRNSLTKLRELYNEKVQKDLSWIGALISRIPPYRWIGKLLQKPAPEMRFANYPSFMESDLSWRRKRVQVSQLIQKFQEHSLEDLELFSKLLDLEGSNLKFGVHGDVNLKTMLPTQVWIAIGLAIAWCAFWARAFGYDMPPIMTTINAILSGSSLLAFLAFVGFVFGLFLIWGLAIGKYENMKQGSKIALISRWLKFYIEVSNNANSLQHKDT